MEDPRCFYVHTFVFLDINILRQEKQSEYYVPIFEKLFTLFYGAETMILDTGTDWVEDTGLRILVLA